MKFNLQATGYRGYKEEDQWRSMRKGPLGNYIITKFT